MLPALDLAARQNKEYLLRMHAKNEILYQYPHTFESFPSDDYDQLNWGFIRDKQEYYQAHTGEF